MVQIGGIGTHSLHFASDTVLLAESPSERQVIVNRVVEASEILDMKVCIEKSEIQYMGRANKNFNIVKKNWNLTQIVTFVYLE